MRSVILRGEKMALYFDKNEFTKNAPHNIRRSLPKSHLEILHGMEVVKASNVFKYVRGEDYIVEHYEVEGKGFYLYPICESWCSYTKQITLSI